MTKANGGHDWSSREGRAALDKAVLGRLTKTCPMARGTVAYGLGLDISDRRAVNAVSAALARLCAAGKATGEGDKGQRTYLKVARS